MTGWCLICRAPRVVPAARRGGRLDDWRCPECRGRLRGPTAAVVRALPPWSERAGVKPWAYAVRA